jgi:hypothetical protein
MAPEVKENRTLKDILESMDPMEACTIAAHALVMEAQEANAGEMNIGITTERGKYTVTVKKEEE